jgi:hypothetical protein
MSSSAATAPFSVWVTNSSPGQEGRWVRIRLEDGIPEDTDALREKIAQKMGWDTCGAFLAGLRLYLLPWDTTIHRSPPVPPLNQLIPLDPAMDLASPIMNELLKNWTPPDSTARQDISEQYKNGLPFGARIVVDMGTQADAGAVPPQAQVATGVVPRGSGVFDSKAVLKILAFPVLTIQTALGSKLISPRSSDLKTGQKTSRFDSERISSLDTSGLLLVDDTLQYWQRCSKRTIPSVPNSKFELDEGKATNTGSPEKGTYHQLFHEIIMEDLKPLWEGKSKMFYEEAFTDDNKKPDFCLTNLQEEVPSSCGHTVALEVKTSLSFLGGRDQALKYAAARYISTLKALAYKAGILSFPPPVDTEVSDNQVRGLLHDLQSWINVPFYACYLSVEKIGLVSIRYVAKSRPIPAADDFDGLVDYVSDADIVWSFLEPLPLFYSVHDSKYNAMKHSPTPLSSVAPAECSTGFSLLCRILATPAEVHKRVLAPPSVMNLCPGRFTNSTFISAGGTSIAFLMSADNERLVIKVPVWPRKNVDNAKSYEKEARLLRILNSADGWESPPPFPQVIEECIQESGPHLLLSPYGRPLHFLTPDDFGDVALVKKLINDVLTALKIAHTRSPPIYHNDVRPPNIVVVDMKRAVLIDWGHAEQPSVETSASLDEGLCALSISSSAASPKNSAKYDVLNTLRAFYNVSVPDVIKQAINTRLEKLISSTDDLYDQIL